MARAVLAALFALSLALAACSDSSNDSSTTQSPYAGGAGTQPTAPPRTPLTQEQLDKWAKIQLDYVKTKPKTPAENQAMLERHGMTETEWGALYQRMSDAYGALIRLEKRNEPVPPEMVGDVELIKANREKVEKARAGKE